MILSLGRVLRQLWSTCNFVNYYQIPNPNTTNTTNKIPISNTTKTTLSSKVYISGDGTTVMNVVHYLGFENTRRGFSMQGNLHRKLPPKSLLWFSIENSYRISKVRVQDLNSQHKPSPLSLIWILTNTLSKNIEGWASSQLIGLKTFDTPVAPDKPIN